MIAVATVVPILTGPLKRSIMSRIANLGLADPNNLADWVQVESTMPADPERKCVFGGRTSWQQTSLLAERNAAFQQVITFEVRIRVAIPGGDPDEADKEAERIQALIAWGVCADPDLTGGRGRIVATSGDSDPIVVIPDPEPGVIVNMGLTFTATLAVVGA